MGGRGAYSYSGAGALGGDGTPLNAYAVASLNTGIADGTTPEQAVARFREQLMDKKVEYSAYIDNAGYVHSLASTGKEGSTKVAPPSSVAHEKGVSTIIHNHPHGTSDGRKWGGPLSGADLEYVASAHRASGGKVNRIVATSKEGTYQATVTRKVSKSDVANATRRAESRLKSSGVKYRGEKAMWAAVHEVYASEFGKIGITISFTPQSKRSGKLTTQKTGTY